MVEVRHWSFQDRAFIQLLRDRGVSPVYVDSEDYPSIPDVTGDVVYARLQRGREAIKTGYAPNDLDAWAGRAKTWAQGSMPGDLDLVDSEHAPDAKPRDVYVYFIHEGKVRAPAAAMALIERLD